MALILTFLGKGGSGRTTLAIAAAKKLASLGERVLLIGRESDPAMGLFLESSLGCHPQEISANLAALQLRTTELLERGWEQVKELEAQYLRSPTLKNVYGQELSILPGMDSALCLNALREYDGSGKYSAIVYDGPGDLTTLRMLGIPEVLSWYVRRFGRVFTDSDIGRTVSPFIQPVASALLNVSWSGDDLVKEPQDRANQLLDQGRAVLADPKRLAAYLVTTEDEAAIFTARYLWGSAQQIGLTVGGVLLNQAEIRESISTQFSPLKVASLPRRSGSDWQSLIDALPDFRENSTAPKPIVIDIAARQVKVFLPGFDKKQVKLTQYGPEITIEVGDQRRNIVLPPALSGQPVTGAKFQDKYLIISL